MGIGDELMLTGQARRAQETDARKIRVHGIGGVERWHWIWEGNPRLAGPGEQGDFQIIVNGPNARPYIEGKTDQKWYWKEFHPEPGEIYLTREEKKYAAAMRPGVVIEPTIKKGASPNKLWPRWQLFVALALKAGITVTQLGPAGTRAIRGAKFIATPDFRKAAAVLANATAYVGHEGGMHHAAAALGIPAVVIRGAFIGPKVTGYPQHRDLFFGPGLGCGMRVSCRCCAVAMARITAEMVLEETRGLL